MERRAGPPASRYTGWFNVLPHKSHNARSTPATARAVRPSFPNESVPRHIRSLQRSIAPTSCPMTSGARHSLMRIAATCPVSASPRPQVPSSAMTLTHTSPPGSRRWTGWSNRSRGVAWTNVCPHDGTAGRRPFLARRRRMQFTYLYVDYPAGHSMSFVHAFTVDCRTLPGSQLFQSNRTIRRLQINQSPAAVYCSVDRLADAALHGNGEIRFDMPV